LNKAVSLITENYKLEEINKRPEIQATRLAYKKLGKEPNRYRPSSEALCRRIVKNITLYKVNAIVDIVNIVSVRTGFSIGAFDVSKIKGDLFLDRGSADENFEAIGRGQLNIDGLPVYRDDIGGIGTPTSDNERTKIDLNTTELFVIINGYSGEQGISEAMAMLSDLLLRYCKVSELKTAIIH
jgi:DNA/RNA-binding domain of Phe-tRNA-synthetase-like protein